MKAAMFAVMMMMTTSDLSGFLRRVPSCDSVWLTSIVNDDDDVVRTGVDARVVRYAMALHVG